MKRIYRLLMLITAAALAAAPALAAAAAQGSAPAGPEGASGLMTQEEAQRLVRDCAEEFFRDEGLKEELAGEIRSVREVIPTSYFPAEEREYFVLTHGGASMRFFMETVGEPGENGRYPLYIALHGGGGAPAEQNNDEWIYMAQYYRASVTSGICVACRGITDTWDLHFRDESYPLYDRLIEAMAVLYGADPDRVYLLGFSAGGDGVYQAAPRLADRFAAAGMSSGHPNGVSLLNMANCPICLQSGIRDWYSESAARCVRTAEFDAALSRCREKYGFGYEHLVLIHVPAGHNFIDSRDHMSLVLKDPSRFAQLAAGRDVLGLFLDVFEGCGLGRGVDSLSYFPVKEDEAFDEGITRVAEKELALKTALVNSNAVRWVSQFTRDSAPSRLVWDLSTRAKAREKDSFYWLKADPSVDKGVITASYDASENAISVEAEGVNGDFAILFHPALVDVSRPVTVRAGGAVHTVAVRPSAEFLKASMLENADPSLGCVGMILYSEAVRPD